MARSTHSSQVASAMKEILRKKYNASAYDDSLFLDEVQYEKYISGQVWVTVEPTDSKNKVGFRVYILFAAMPTDKDARAAINAVQEELYDYAVSIGFTEGLPGDYTTVSYDYDVVLEFDLNKEVGKWGDPLNAQAAIPQVAARFAEEVSPEIDEMLGELQPLCDKLYDKLNELLETV